MPTRYYEFKSLGLKTNFEARKYPKTRHRLDRIFEERVRQYIQENQRKSFIDADDLVNSLRQKYPEYLRRQKAAVKYLAGRVFAKLTREEEDSQTDADENMSVEHIASDSEDRSNLSNISSEDEMPVTTSVPTSSTNDEILKMYKQQRSKTREDDEFINISSDENMKGNRSSSGSTITLDDDQVNTTNISVTQMRKRKLSNQTESAKFPSSENICSKNGDTSTLNSSIVSSENKKRKGGKSADLNVSKTRKSITFEESISSCNIPTSTLEDVAGYQKVILEIIRLVKHLKHPEFYECTGVPPPRGFLLHGPSGCGKTFLANAVAGQLRVPLIDIAGPELVAGISGISEQRIRKLFETALKLSPCVLFIDEIDCITQNRNTANRDMERRIVSQLLLSLDKLNKDPKGSQVLVIGATNRPNSLDPSLRRAGRFDKEVCVGIPDKASRYDILKFLCSKLCLADDVNLKEIAAHTPGYVGADLQSLICESAQSAIDRVLQQVSISQRLANDEENSSTSDLVGQRHSKLNQPNDEIRKSLLLLDNKFSFKEEYAQKVYISQEDFKRSLKRVQPSSKREGFAIVPDVTWDDIGSLKDIRVALLTALLCPLKYPKKGEILGLQASMGVLLCGPPGCGKTLLAKAMANEADINFISVKGPELLNMYVGESEKAVRECFYRAKNSQPCVIFFDELDALCPKRSDHSENGAGVRVVTQLLTEMDGVQSRTGVFLMAATNRPDIIDPAVLRPGRFEKILYVGFPNEEDRADILRALTKNGTKPPLHKDVSLLEIAKNPLCDGFTGADLAALVRDASMLALEEHNSISENDDDCDNLFVAAKHFNQALQNLRPSVSEKDRKHYEQLRIKFGTSAYQKQRKNE